VLAARLIVPLLVIVFRVRSAVDARNALLHPDVAPADNGAAEADVRFSLITELYRRRFLKRSSRSRLHRTIYRPATIACNRALVFGRADTFFRRRKATASERCCRSFEDWC